MRNMRTIATTRKAIRREGQQYNLFFIRPKARTDVHRYAERLASMGNVTEVMVTEGECGFIVKAKGSHDTGEKQPILSRNSYKRITSYYQYRK